MTLGVVAMASYVFEGSSVSGPRLNRWKSEYSNSVVRIRLEGATLKYEYVGKCRKWNFGS